MDIYITSLKQAFEVARLHKPATIISLLNPQEDFPDFRPTPRHHHLFAIHDIDHHRHHLQSATHQDILRLIDCFLQHDEMTSPLLVHCLLGSSRSAAAAYIFLNVHTTHRELEIAHYLRAYVPHAHPNRAMVAHADGILGRGGRMIKAIDHLPPVDLKTLGTICKISTDFMAQAV